jgi:hypothetical protein
MLDVPAIPVLASYAAAGFRVFPLGLRSKEPMIAKRDGGRGCHDATKDLTQLETFWRRWPRANMGIATGEGSGITVIDIDPANGGERSVAALAAKGLTFPPTLRAVTPNGGWHLVYRHQPGILNWSGKIAPGIDTRSTGGYIVAAPSRVPRKIDGVMAEYAWIDPNTGEIREDACLPADMEIAPFPAWVLDLVAPKPVYRAFRSFKPISDERARGAIQRQADLIAKEREGNRNGALSARSFFLHHNYVQSGSCGERELESVLHDAALANGLNSTEALKTIRKAFRSAQQKGQ